MNSQQLAQSLGISIDNLKKACDKLRITMPVDPQARFSSGQIQRLTELVEEVKQRKQKKVAESSSHEEITPRGTFSGSNTFPEMENLEPADVGHQEVSHGGVFDSRSTVLPGEPLIPEVEKEFELPASNLPPSEIREKSISFENKY